MHTFLKRIVWVIVLIPAVYLAVVWQQVPESVALHFNWEGKADRYGSKSELVTMAVIITVMNLLLYLLLTNIYRIDPKKYAADNKERLQRIALTLVIFMSSLLCLIIYSSIHGNTRFTQKLILAGVAVLIAILGNYMYNIKPNYFAGIRLPWTLEDEDNWKKTHALAGKLWFAGGLCLSVLCLFLPAPAAMIVFISTMVILVLIPMIYSFRLYLQKKKQHTNN